ncbi:MAG: hypothetical protein QE485_13265 [Acidovorax sp.]|uniref:hypothetical protein n=1 Tax=Acidovorax sp. TaxID=1872122 RepID=UPI0026116176|nr:hypothetical protein [Acidovorax sp.]MDH4418187.1 hypothetical protein [Acidovorax sp.]
MEIVRMVKLSDVVMAKAAVQRGDAADLKASRHLLRGTLSIASGFINISRRLINQGGAP